MFHKLSVNKYAITVMHINMWQLVCEHFFFIAKYTQNKFKIATFFVFGDQNLKLKLQVRVL